MVVVTTEKTAQLVLQVSNKNFYDLKNYANDMNLLHGWGSLRVFPFYLKMTFTCDLKVETKIIKI